MKLTLLLTLAFQFILSSSLNAQEVIDIVYKPSPSLCSEKVRLNFFSDHEIINNDHNIHPVKMDLAKAAIDGYGNGLRTLPDTIIWNPKSKELSYPSIKIHDSALIAQLNNRFGFPKNDTSDVCYAFPSNKDLMPKSFFIPIHTLDTIVRNVTFFKRAEQEDTTSLGVRLYLGLRQEKDSLGTKTEMSAYVGPAFLKKDGDTDKAKDYIFYDQDRHECYLLNLITPCPAACDTTSVLYSDH